MSTTPRKWSGRLSSRAIREWRRLKRRTWSSITPVSYTHLSAAHLAYAGQTDAALALLKRAVEDGYCAVPAIDSDTMFAGVRGMAGFAEIRAAGMACQKEFRAEREK